MADLDYRDIAEWAFGSAFEQDEKYDHGRDIPEAVREKILQKVEDAARSSDNEETASDLAAQEVVALRDEYAATLRIDEMPYEIDEYTSREKRGYDWTGGFTEAARVLVRMGKLSKDGVDSLISVLNEWAKACIDPAPDTDETADENRYWRRRYLDAAEKIGEFRNEAGD